MSSPSTLWGLCVQQYGHLPDLALQHFDLVEQALFVACELLLIAVRHDAVDCVDDDVWIDHVDLFDAPVGAG